jgi:hypothetical protein
MTDKEYRDEKKRLQGLINKWVNPIGLGWYDIKFVWVRSEYDNSVSAYSPIVGKDQRYTCIMATSVDYFYRMASITFFMEVSIQYSPEDLEEYFVHELMHIFLKPLQDKRKFAEEELVATSLAKGFIYIRGNQDVKYAK